MTRKKNVVDNMTAAESRFIADCMLGTLAKKLRFIGYDTLFFRRIEDAKIVDIAVREDRIILTRDSGLLRRKAVRRGVFIDSDNLEAQLKKVIAECGLKADESGSLSRCLVCNTPLTSINKRKVIGKVPPFVFLSHSRFNYCSRCNKIYWAGSHITNAMNIQQNMIREENGDGKNV